CIFTEDGSPLRVALFLLLGLPGLVFFLFPQPVDLLGFLLFLDAGALGESQLAAVDIALHAQNLADHVGGSGIFGQQARPPPPAPPRPPPTPPPLFRPPPP